MEKEIPSDIEEHAYTLMPDVQFAMAEILVMNYVRQYPHHRLAPNVSGIFHRIKKGKLLYSEKQILRQKGFRFKEVEQCQQ